MVYVANKILIKKLSIVKIELVVVSSCRLVIGQDKLVSGLNLRRSFLRY